MSSHSLTVQCEWKHFYKRDQTELVAKVTHVMHEGAVVMDCILPAAAATVQRRHNSMMKASQLRPTSPAATSLHIQ
jgi:hypothetical protein